MTFADFRTLALELLDVDATRRGIESLRNRLLRAAVADLKHYIPEFEDNRGAYEDTDPMPYDGRLVDRVAEAVALFMKSRITRLTEGDLVLAASFERDYIGARRWLYRRARELSETMLREVMLMVTRGDSHDFEIEVQLDGNPVDLTGQSLTLTIKQHEDDDAECAVFTLTNAASGGIVYTNAVAGIATASLTPEQTEQLLPGVTYFFDVQLTLSTGKVHTVLTGRIRARKDITTPVSQA